MKHSVAHFFIVTPSYNQAQFIQETIDSVAAQNWPQVTHWVIDGKSSDSTLKLIKQSSLKLPQLNYISEPDQGQSDALNKGVRKLKDFVKKHPGKSYFAYINSDDFYEKDAFRVVDQAFTSQPDKMWLVGDCRIIDAQGKTMQEPIRYYKKFWRYFLNKFTLLILNPVPQPATFIRAEAVLETGFFNQNLHYVMDYEYWLKLMTSYGSPIVVSETLAAFRIHNQSKGGTRFKQQFAEQRQIAGSFSQNQLVLSLQTAHNWLITTVYTILK